MQIKRVIAGVLIIILTTNTFVHMTVAMETPFYSVLFIIDVSNSMNTQDPENLVAETAKMLIDTLPTSRAEVGFIAFNDTIVADFPLTPLNEPGIRQELKNAIETLPIQGSSDIGYALLHGINTIAYKNNEKPNQQPIIILFSDGETNLTTSRRWRTYEDSFTDKAYALALATQLNAPIHTIGVSWDGTLNADYLMEISQATQGRHHVIRNANALSTIFGEFRTEAFSGETHQNTVITLESDWQYITVDTLGYYADEVNIILHYEERSVRYVLAFYRGSEVYISNHFTSVRIQNPSENGIVLGFFSDIGNVIRTMVVNYIPPPPENIPPILLSESNTIVLELEHAGENLFDLMEYFYNEDGGLLTFEIIEMDDSTSGTVIQEGGLLSIIPTSTHSEFTIIADDGQGGTVQAIFVVTVPFWTFYRNHTIAIAIAIILLIVALLISRLSKRKQEAPIKATPSTRFSGARFEGYFMKTLSGDEIPVLNWNASFVENRHKTSLGELFQAMNVDEKLPEASKIYLEAGNNSSLIFYHDTLCIIVISNKAVPKDKKVVLHYDERIYITFEDHVTEIELRYKKAKKIV